MHGLSATAPKPCVLSPSRKHGERPHQRSSPCHPGIRCNSSCRREVRVPCACGFFGIVGIADLIFDPPTPPLLVSRPLGGQRGVPPFSHRYMSRGACLGKYRYLWWKHRYHDGHSAHLPAHLPGLVRHSARPHMVVLVRGVALHQVPGVARPAFPSVHRHGRGKKGRIQIADIFAASERQPILRHQRTCKHTASIP